jgi:hypothetical protein
MSVTFWVAKQTLTKEPKPCPECGGKASENCNWCIDGVVMDYSSDCTEMNLANSNARALLCQLYPEGAESCGEWPLSLLPGINRRLLRIINTKQSSALISETTELHNPGRATFIEMGRSQEQVARYYATLLQIIKDAQRLESPVIWG